MEIEILGSGCKRCEQLYENTLSAVSETSEPVRVLKVNDVNYFTKKGVFMTPAIVIDGKVVSVGKTLSVQEIRDIVNKNSGL